MKNKDTLLLRETSAGDRSWVRVRIINESIVDANCEKQKNISHRKHWGTNAITKTSQTLGFKIAKSRDVFEHGITDEQDRQNDQ